MCIDFSGGNVLVAQKSLDGSEVCSVFEKVGGKGVAQCVAGDSFMDLCAESGSFDCFIKNLWMKMMPTRDLSFRGR